MADRGDLHLTPSAFKLPFVNDSDAANKATTSKKKSGGHTRPEHGGKAGDDDDDGDGKNSHGHGRSSSSLLLHGLLHVKIIRATDLRSVDYVRKLDVLRPDYLSDSASDPYVTLRGDEHVSLVRTGVIHNSLNPVWDEEFCIPVAHHLSTLTFEVVDSIPVSLEDGLVGRHTLDVSELVRFDDDDDDDGEKRRRIRVGIHRIATLVEDRGRNPLAISAPLGMTGKSASLEYYVEFVPVDMIPPTLKVPRVYFEERVGNSVKLYVNADDRRGLAPDVTYGGGPDGDRHRQVWNPNRLWRDIYDSMCSARHFIYVAAWSVDTTQSLLRGRERSDALLMAEGEGGYSPLIGELLKRKAEEGVRVNMLVWDDETSHFTMPGIMKTHDEESYRFFRGTRVNFKLVPMNGTHFREIRKALGKVFMFSHHQKIIILDAPCEDGGTPYDCDDDRREPVAYVGGNDLTKGRWDSREHALFRTLDGDHGGDAYNKCVPQVQKFGPRQPWHDIHTFVRGPVVLDVIRNFTERWCKQESGSSRDLLDLHAVGLLADPIERDGDADGGGWCNQVLRSIDSQNAAFDGGSRPSSTTDREGVDYIRGMASAIDEEINAGLNVVKNVGATVKDRLDWFRGRSELKGWRRTSEMTQEFESSDMDTFSYDRKLHRMDGSDVDTSVHDGLVHHIRRAEHTLYIESQYFMGSSFMWSESRATNCGNLIPAEITLKICRKIEAGERFAAYILLPMWPDGLPESSAMQAMLYWQKLTIEAMYTRIAAALERKRLDALRIDRLSDGTTKSVTKGESPRDYLNFYCLAKRECPDQYPKTKERPPTSYARILAESRRFQVYVHSKMVIVDDTVILNGSANINERSLAGIRDSEILLASYQPTHVATRQSFPPHGDVHGFRMHCWATITGRMEDVFRDSSSLECIRRFNEIAEGNWNTFLSEECSEMTSHLIPYPVDVLADGSLRPRPDLEGGCFPDTKAVVTGTKSAVIPEILTT